ncbi:MAG: Uma2 family endonuclease [Xenococcaceae cyanobacterium MO_207.B15]|nr:Uma2 family endonuclease [Xenococcaceae cyanobacterium MO_207.B15]
MKTLYKWSVEEYHRMIETGLLEGKSVELLEGEIITMSPEGIPHTFTNHSVVEYLRKLLAGLAIVREAHPITLDNSEPEPDIAVVRLPDTIYAQHHPYAQDIYWLIEIADRTLNKDLFEKNITYARNGIAEYWVIDLPNKKLWVMTNPQDNNYLDVQEFTTGIVKPVAFLNIEVELNKLLLF